MLPVITVAQESSPTEHDVEPAAPSANVVHLSAIRSRRDAGEFGAAVRLREAEPVDGPGSVAGSLIDVPFAPETSICGLPARSTGRTLFRFGLVASLIFHVAVIAAMSWQSTDASSGAGGQELESVSVEIVSAAALESVAVRSVEVATGAIGAIEATPGTEGVTPQEEIEAATPASVPESAAPQVPIKAQPTDEATADVVAAELSPKSTSVAEAPVQPTTEPTPQPVAAQAAVEAGGGSTSAAREESVAGDAAAGASAGQLARYAMEVRQAIGRSRPKHKGGRGRVQVSFVLDAAGGLVRAEVSRSSGDAALDRAALVAIQRTSFPLPPSGATSAQLTYLAPFDFK